MKTVKLPISILTILIAAITLSACGKTNRASSGANAETVVVPPAPCTVGCNPIEPTPSPTSSPTPTNPALSYEFTLKGNQVATTPNTITTDNVLKVKFRVTAEQGNHIWKASELKVTIAVNGTEVTPTYTNSAYTYGRVGETSNVVDLSAYVTPGQSSQITVKLPKNDFYCTYWGGYYFDTSMAYSPYYGLAQAVNPQYNQYPGCRKEVHYTHNWSGVLIVQTSNTQAI